MDQDVTQPETLIFHLVSEDADIVKQVLELEEYANKDSSIALVSLCKSIFERFYQQGG